MTQAAKWDRVSATLQLRCDCDRDATAAAAVAARGREPAPAAPLHAPWRPALSLQSGSRQHVAHAESLRRQRQTLVGRRNGLVRLPRVSASEHVLGILCAAQHLDHLVPPLQVVGCPHPCRARVVATL